MKKQQRLILVFTLALTWKLSLFCFALGAAPQSKFPHDSHLYLSTAKTLSSHGVFGHRRDNGTFSFEMYRTPGYPLFLSFVHGFAGFSLSIVILIQILLTILTAGILFKSAELIDSRAGFLSALFILFDPAITIYSMMILTESLFLFLITIFLFLFIKYLKEKRIFWLFFSALLLVLATYVRPVTYYLGAVISLFLLCIHFRKNIFLALKHAFVFFFLVYVLIGIWHVRNEMRNNVNQFSTISNATVALHGFKGSDQRQEGFGEGKVPAIQRYFNIGVRSFLSLMTQPASFKYFNSNLLKVVGKIFSYPWICFWLIGMFVGMASIRDNQCLAFITLIILYFIAATVGSTTLEASARFRVAFMPFIAVLSAFGWMTISQRLSIRGS